MLQAQEAAGTLPAPFAGPRPSFSGALLGGKGPVVIAEYKRASPSLGNINLDVEPEEHAVAFTVAKAMQIDVLTTIREEVQKALDEGLPLETFQKNLKPRLVALGWWGRKEMVDPQTGDTVDSWKVIIVEEEKQLTLLFGMKAPGLGRLSFTINDKGDHRELDVRAWWHPHGMPGLIYWLLMIPAHLFIFRGMAQRIARLAEQISGRVEG